MILLYTGAINYNQPSTPDRSHGGNVSSTQVLNGQLSNLFSLITKTQVLNNQKEVKLIVLKNTTSTPVTGLKFWTEIATGLSKFKLKLGLVSPSFDSTCNKYYFEQLLNSFNLPFQANFTEHEGISNQMLIGLTLQPNQMIGIWILREFTESFIDSFTTQQVEEICSDESILALQTQLESNNIPSNFNFNLKVEWD